MDTIENCLYINLENRPDRKDHVENQLNQLNISYKRFNAIRHQNGAAGCSLSHIKCIQIAQEEGWKNVMIVEDDINFLDFKLFKTNLNKFLINEPNFDVVLLAGNNMPPYTQINDFCVKVSRCQTTTGYIVNSHYYKTLINNYKEGLLKLMKSPEEHVKYAIDKYWFNLQKKDYWFLITPLSVIQREDYSDIEKKNTNYSNAMLDLDKKEFFRRIQLNQQRFQSLLKISR